MDWNHRDCRISWRLHELASEGCCSIWVATLATVSLRIGTSRTFNFGLMAIGQSDPPNVDKNGEKRERTSKIQGSHGATLVPKQPMNLDVMARHAQSACTQIYHTVISWMARSSVVFFSDMLWQSNFAALLSSIIIIDRFVLQFSCMITKGRRNKEQIHCPAYLLVLATCQAFSFSSLDSLD